MREYFGLGIATMLITAVALGTLRGQESELRDVVYGTQDGIPLKLDLYRPRMPKAPIIVWVHGGAWRRGSKDSVPVLKLVEHGYAIASVDYRLSPVARFPAQVIDIRNAIIHLREHAREYAIDADRLAIAGASAGGHLAALVGLSQGVGFTEDGSPQLEPGSIKAILSFYGASNLETILSQSTPHGLKVRIPALDLLLGGGPDQQTSLAQLASPIQHVDGQDPPLMLIHGDQDPQMPINQAHELVGRYAAVDGDVRFEVVYGGAHGGPEFYSERMLTSVQRFLEQNTR